jgi:hypothetical protein
MTLEVIEESRSFSHIMAFISLIFGFLSVFVVIRYTTYSMKDYRFHLFNISLSILISDLWLNAILGVKAAYPASEFCIVGPLHDWLTEKLGVRATVHFGMVGFLISFLCV